jgi:hypothetical protein
MRKQQRKQLRLIAVSLAQPALQLGALQQQLIAARKMGLGRCSIWLVSAEALGSLLGAHERKVDKKERGDALKKCAKPPDCAPHRPGWLLLLLLVLLLLRQLPPQVSQYCGRLI